MAAAARLSSRVCDMRRIAMARDDAQSGFTAPA
jgi:hypothetical protein